MTSGLTSTSTAHPLATSWLRNRTPGLKASFASVSTGALSPSEGYRQFLFASYFLSQTTLGRLIAFILQKSRRMDMTEKSAKNGTVIWAEWQTGRQCRAYGKVDEEEQVDRGTCLLALSPSRMHPRLRKGYFWSPFPHISPNPPKSSQFPPPKPSPVCLWSWDYCSNLVNQPPNRKRGAKCKRISPRPRIRHSHTSRPGSTAAAQTPIFVLSLIGQIRTDMGNVCVF